MARTLDIERAAATLRSGRLLAFPTEAVYGVGADAENAAVVRGRRSLMSLFSTHSTTEERIRRRRGLTIGFERVPA